MREIITRDMPAENHLLKDPFTPAELTAAIKVMKSNKSPGVDEIRTEQIKNFGEKAKEWLLKMMNECVQNMHIPKM